MRALTRVQTDEDGAAAASATARGGRKRRTLGRQKIEIKPIRCKEARHVCFSKRRAGLFKKATELSVLCGAHVAVVVFSPAERPFSYGHPSVDAVIDRFLDPASASSSAAGATHPAVVLHEFESQRDRLTRALEAEARRREALDEAARAAGVWTSDDVERAGVPDLLALHAALERVQAEAAERAQEIAAAEESPMMMQCAVAGDVFPYFGGAGAYTGDGLGVGSHYQQVADPQMMPIGGNVSHGLPFAPMRLPSDLPPPPPFGHGSDHRSHVAAGYGYELGDGTSHGAAYETRGLYGTATCNFFT